MNRPPASASSPSVSRPRNRRPGNPRRRSIWRRVFRRGPWENAASLVIAVGVVMLMQPLSIWLYGWSFTVILVGTVGFIIVSHFPD